MRYLFVTLALCACEPLKSTDTADTAEMVAMHLADGVYYDKTCEEIKDDGNVIVREMREITAYTARVSTDGLLWDDITSAVSYNTKHRALWLNSKDACPDEQILRLVYTVIEDE